jgi:hypothetical protein
MTAPKEIAAAIRSAAKAYAPRLDRGIADPMIVVAQVTADAIEQDILNPDEAHNHLNNLRDLVGAMECSDLDEPAIQAARDAHAATCDLLGFPLTEGKPHQPMLPAAQLARHLADLIDFHRDDPDDVRHHDPIEVVARRVDENGAVLRVTLQSGLTFLVLVAQEG